MTENTYNKLYKKNDELSRDAVISNDDAYIIELKNKLLTCKEVTSKFAHEEDRRHLMKIS